MPKIILVDDLAESKSELMLQAMKEKYGNDIVLVTPEEATIGYMWRTHAQTFKLNNNLNRVCHIYLVSKRFNYE